MLLFKRLMKKGLNPSFRLEATELVYKFVTGFWVYRASFSNITEEYFHGMKKRPEITWGLYATSQH
jgi:hypothetical protein